MHCSDALLAAAMCNGSRPSGSAMAAASGNAARTVVTIRALQPCRAAKWRGCQPKLSARRAAASGRAASRVEITAAELP